MTPKLDYRDDVARVGIAQWQNVADEVAELSADVAGVTEEPSSPDRIGAAFLRSFIPDRTTVSANVAALADKLAGYPPALTSTADDFDQV